jgi:hypothetical protein
MKVLMVLGDMGGGFRKAGDYFKAARDAGAMELNHFAQALFVLLGQRIDLDSNRALRVPT